MLAKRGWQGRPEYRRMSSCVCAPLLQSMVVARYLSADATEHGSLRQCYSFTTTGGPRYRLEGAPLLHSMALCAGATASPRLGALGIALKGRHCYRAWLSAPDKDRRRQTDRQTNTHHLYLHLAIRLGADNTHTKNARWSLKGLKMTPPMLSWVLALPNPQIHKLTTKPMPI